MPPLRCGTIIKGLTGQGRKSANCTARLLSTSETMQGKSASGHGSWHYTMHLVPQAARRDAKRLLDILRDDNMADELIPAGEYAKWRAHGEGAGRGAKTSAARPTPPSPSQCTLAKPPSQRRPPLPGRTPKRTACASDHNQRVSPGSASLFSLFADRCGATAQVVCDCVRAPSRLVMAAHPPSSFSSVYDMLASSVSFIALTATDGLNLYVACSADESASAPLWAGGRSVGRRTAAPPWAPGGMCSRRS